MTDDDDLRATWFIDHEADTVRAFVADAIGDAVDETERVRRLFAAVRDRVRYDPYSLTVRAEDYRASVIAVAGGAYCVPKALLFVACCRAIGVPARIGFADVRNHLQSERLLALMGTDLFRYHGYAAIHRDGRWVKASPAFNRELCARFGVPPLDFDGETDALMHPYTSDGRRHMEYVADHGTRPDLPLEEMLAVFRETYPAITERGLTVDGTDAAFAA